MIRLLIALCLACSVAIADQTASKQRQVKSKLTEVASICLKNLGNTLNEKITAIEVSGNRPWVFRTPVPKKNGLYAVMEAALGEWKCVGNEDEPPFGATDWKLSESNHFTRLPYVNDTLYFPLNKGEKRKVLHSSELGIVFEYDPNLDVESAISQIAIEHCFKFNLSAKNGKSVTTDSKNIITPWHCININ